MTDDAKSYLLVKSDGFTPEGAYLTARECADRLLEAREWPLWQRTPHRKNIREGDRLAVYITGDSEVVASARVLSVRKWRPHALPLMMERIPASLIELDEIRLLPAPFSFAARRRELTFIPPRVVKWGAFLTGGVKRIPDCDYWTITGQ